MTIEYINTGTIANDGTGDDLREAFTKINNNFEELDLRIVETTFIENTGTFGQPIYAGITDGIHGIKRLVAGTNVTLGSTDTYITINAADSLDELIIISDNGTLTVTRGQTMSLSGGEGITTRVDGQQLIVSLDDTGIVNQDTAPSLGGDLNANNYDITGVTTLQATTINGALEGLVYGFDIREIGNYLTGFDFGTIRNTYKNSLEFILANVDLDFATISPDRGDTVDFGFLTP